MRDNVTSWLARAAGAITASLALASGAPIVVALLDIHPGFDTSSTRYGTGLQGMTDRLDAIGGSLEVHSAPSAGTTVTGHVPASTTGGSA